MPHPHSNTVTPKTYPLLILHLWHGHPPSCPGLPLFGFIPSSVNSSNLFLSAALPSHTGFIFATYTALPHLSLHPHAPHPIGRSSSPAHTTHLTNNHNPRTNPIYPPVSTLHQNQTHGAYGCLDLVRSPRIFLSAGSGFPSGALPPSAGKHSLAIAVPFARQSRASLTHRYAVNDCEAVSTHAQSFAWLLRRRRRPLRSLSWLRRLNWRVFGNRLDGDCLRLRLDRSCLFLFVCACYIIFARSTGSSARLFVPCRALTLRTPQRDFLTSPLMSAKLTGLQVYFY